MIIKIESNKIVVGFPLTQPKRAWKLRTNDKKSAARIIGHSIQNNHFLEWMVDYSELRDILYCLKEVEPQNFSKILDEFNKAKPEVLTPDEVKLKPPKKLRNIIIEMQLLGKQYKPSEKFPYIFVLLKLGYEKIADNLYIIDKGGVKINKTIDRVIKSGDALIWFPSVDEILAIVSEFAFLCKEHKDRAQKDIFDKI